MLPPPRSRRRSGRIPVQRSGVADFVLAFMDCEFGGLDPELHDITEVAIVVTDDRLAELASASWKVRARADRISPEGARISGYSEEAWRDAPSIRQVLTEVTELLPTGLKAVPAGQNVRMDVLFLEKAYRGCDLPYPFDYHVIDLATLFYAWSLVVGEPVAALSLRQAAITAGLIEGAVPHRGDLAGGVGRGRFGGARRGESGD